MKKFLTILGFFLLLEYQVFFGQNNYSLITAAGLVLLCLYEFFTEDKYIFFREQKLSDYHGTQLTLGEKLGAGVYGVILILSIILGSGWGAQLAFILIAGILGVTIISIREIKKSQQNGQNISSTLISSFTIPKFFLFLLNYLLSIQIHESFAYQSILLLSAFVLYDLVDHGEKIIERARKGEITRHEFKHSLFHSWSKYWNFLLGVWFFIALRANGQISAEYEYILLFVFMVIFFTLLMRNESTFKIKDFFGTVIFALLLAGISPLMSAVVKNEMPAYLLAAIIFVAFDLGDIYFHQREFKEANLKFWTQKAAVYLLIGIYIAQVHFMMTHSIFGIDQVVVSVLKPS